MKQIQHYLNKAHDVTINIKGVNRVLISKDELKAFIHSVYGKQFTTKAQAKRLTGLSYLGGVNTSAKIVKGLKEDYHTYILYLQAYKTIFGVTCAKADACKDACLNTAGRVKLDIKELTILRARYLKTVLFYVNRDMFVSWLFSEIDTAAKKYGAKFMVRINGTSDLNPVLFSVDGVNVLEQFPNVQFYDYTKILNRTKVADKYPNYHLTFSFDGYNMDECKQAQSKGLNVSIVVDGAIMPTFEGVKVFDMDSTDLRPLDKQKGQFGYLKLKQTLNKNYDSKFIIKA